MRVPAVPFRLLTALACLAAPVFAWQQHGIPVEDPALALELQKLLRVSDPTAGFMALALGVAFLAGAAHALTPGHGKALVAAYLVGSRGTVWDAVYLGIVVTVTHTAMVFALGLVALYASQYVQMERVYGWLTLLSGSLIFAIGASLLWSRWKAMRSGETAHNHQHEHSHGPFGWHTHTHLPPHSHDDHEGGHSHQHSHAHDPADGHGHTHDHEHTHPHSHGHEHHVHEHAHGHEHHHDPRPATGRGSLLSLGVSGGMVPCPEAMVVLLISITINQFLLGLIILVAFSVGLAAVLIAIGIAMVLAGPALKRFASEGPLIRALPVGSAVLVTLMGVAILYSGVTQAGLF
jgi:nickel/cobalt exporter